MADQEFDMFETVDENLYDDNDSGFAQNPYEDEVIDRNEPNQSYQDEEQEELDFDMLIPPAAEPDEEEETQPSEGDDLFDEPAKPTSKKSFDDLTDEELQELLKKRNLNVEQQTPKEEFFEEKEKIRINETYINQAIKYTRMDDSQIVRGKVTEDLKMEFTQKGRDVNSREFHEELDDRMSEYENSRAVTKAYADSIRNQLLQEAHRKKTENEGIEGKIKAAEVQRKTDAENKVKTAFRDIRSSNFYGISVTDDEYRKAHNNLATGKVAHEIENNPILAAEVALFLLKKKDFSEQLGGPTYGEGVRDALQRFAPDDARKSSTQLAMSKGAKGAKNDGLLSREAFWTKQNAQQDDKTKKQAIIGYPR